VEAQTVDDLVDRLALRPEGDPDEIEIFGDDVRDCVEISTRSPLWWFT
jgi:hypothetical protein